MLVRAIVLAPAALASTTTRRWSVLFQHARVANWRAVSPQERALLPQRHGWGAAIGWAAMPHGTRAPALLCARPCANSLSRALNFVRPF